MRRLGVLAVVAALALGGCKKQEDKPAMPSNPTDQVPLHPAVSPAPLPEPVAAGAPAAGAPAPAAPAPTPAAAPAPEPRAAAPQAPAAPPPAASAPAAPPPAASAPPAAPAGDLLTSLGQPCGDQDRCLAGAECKTYYGIAGPAGPAFKSCEIPCSSDGKACPTGTTCVTVADGPGSVCRPL
jgi:hypothetical protein